MYELWKYVLYLLIAAGVAGSGLWMIGGKKKEYSTDLLIEAPPKVVFDYLTKPELMKQWNDSLISTEQLTGSPNEVGSTARRGPVSIL
jgi:hypothetical protein